MTLLLHPMLMQTYAVPQCQQCTLFGVIFYQSFVRPQLVVRKGVLGDTREQNLLLGFYHSFAMPHLGVRRGALDGIGAYRWLWVTVL